MVVCKLNIYFRVALTRGYRAGIQLPGGGRRSVGRSHDADRFSREQPLPNNSVYPAQSGKHCMIAAPVLNDQYLPIRPKRPLKNDLAIEWGDDLGQRPGLQHDAPGLGKIAGRTAKT